MREFCETKGMIVEELSESEELLSNTRLSLEALQARNEAALPCLDFKREVVSVSDLSDTLHKIENNFPQAATEARHHKAKILHYLGWAAKDSTVICHYLSAKEDARLFARGWWS